MPDELDTILAGGEDAAPVAKGKRKRQTRDSEAPKKASSAMAIYIEQNKASLKASDANLSTMEANKKLAEKWKGLSVKDRAPYVKKALEDKARYDEEMAGYEPSAESMVRSTKSGTRLAKDPKRPKKPKTAYLCFADKHRAALAKANPGAGVSVLSKKIAEKWKATSEADKKEFEKMAEEDKERFNEAMVSYEPSAAYLAAKEMFKAKKAGKDTVPPPPALVTVETVADSSEADEVKALKEQLAAQKKQLAEQAKLIEKLQKATDKESHKRSAPADDEPAKKVAKTPPPAKAPKPAKEPAAAAPTDEAHFMVWVQSKIGADGAKASPAMKKVNETKGSEGLAEMLRKEYLKEMKKEEKPAAAPKPAKEPAPKPAAKAEPPAKRPKRS